MILVPFLLATHANAALAGLPVTFGVPEKEAVHRLLWNAQSVEWTFRSGSDEAPRGYGPNEWIEGLRRDGMRRAWFDASPFQGLAGYGIVTEGTTEMRYDNVRFRKVGRLDQISIEAFPIPDRLRLAEETVESAARRLERAIGPILDFATHLGREAHLFAVLLAQAQSYARLVGTGATLEAVEPRVIPLFPADVYPVDNLLLASAALKSSILGGNGSWNDLAVEPRDRDEYRQVTGAFAKTHNPLFSVASRLDRLQGFPGEVVVE